MKRKYLLVLRGKALDAECMVTQESLRGYSTDFQELARLALPKISEGYLLTELWIGSYNLN